METQNLEKRKQFRVNLVQTIVGTAKIISANNTKLDFKKIINILILDLSAGGMRTEMKLNLPIELNFVLRIAFKFENVIYEVLAIIVRKTEKQGIYEYGLKFLETPRDVEKSIIYGLNQVKIRQVKHGKVNLDPQKKRDIKSFIKIIGSYTEPTYLINNQRLIIAANGTAREEGVTLGERCHLSICANRTICSHCKLDDAKMSDELVNNEGMIKGKKYNIFWLYLEEGFTIHYFKRR